MEAPARDAAVALLHAAAIGGAPLDALPEASKPTTVADALAIQDLLVARSGRQVAGFKVATDPTGTVMYGAIYADDCFASPADIAASRYPLMGIEGEIAYRFSADLPARRDPYLRGELERVLSPFPVFEIVQTRYANYQGTPVLDRLADRMSNGGMVLGDAEGEARDFADVAVSLSIDGKVVIDQAGGHSRNDPFLPALDFIRAVQHEKSFSAGQFITTGTFTGLIFATPGQSFAISFAGLGGAELKVI